MGLNSLATVHKHITNLEKKGLFTRDYNKSRSIDLLPPKGRLKQAMSVNTTMVLPLLGRIAAGQPIEAVQNRRPFLWPTLFGRKKFMFSRSAATPCRTKRSSAEIMC